MDSKNIIIKYMPKITDDQLWDFYVRNDICEVGHGKETAVKPLKFNPYIVGAFYDDKLVGLIRAMFDGVSADIMEFCLELELQGENLIYENGSLIEKDKFGIARQMGLLLIEELRKIGNTFVTAYLVEGVEEELYQSIGLKQNNGHLVFIKDERPYVKNQ
ncbi:MAG: hypothetical protein K0S47_3956 [Herbinix sp.]|nr:hypothetical protein [Herbinix sp.]